MPLLTELIPFFYGESYKYLAPPEPLDQRSHIPLRLGRKSRITKESSRTRLTRGDNHQTALEESP